MHDNPLDEDFPAADLDADPFAEPAAPVAETEDEELPKELKNRHVRRLEKKLAETREESIELAARLAERSELTKFQEEVGNDPDIARIYGTETPEAREATRLLQGALSKAEERATEKALAKFQAAQAEQVKAQRDAQRFIDDELESIEEEHGIDLTSDSPQARKACREFLDLVQKASPKDGNGDIKEYADFGAVFDLYNTRREPKQPTRNQDLASRSMVRSGNTQGSVANKATEDYLKQAGII